MHSSCAKIESKNGAFSEAPLTVHLCSTNVGRFGSDVASAIEAAKILNAVEVIHTCERTHEKHALADHMKERAYPPSQKGTP